MTIVPQQSRVVVEPIALDSIIEIPDMDLRDDDGNRIEPPRRWRVVAVGTGRVLDSGVKIEIPLKVGDEVVFDPRYATRCEPIAFYGHKFYLIIDYAGVLGKIERDPDETVTFTPPKKIVKAIPVPKIAIA